MKFKGKLFILGENKCGELLVFPLVCFLKIKCGFQPCGVQRELLVPPRGLRNVGDGVFQRGVEFSQPQLCLRGGRIPVRVNKADSSLETSDIFYWYHNYRIIIKSHKVPISCRK